MAEQVKPYTVSAVVDVTTGASITRPHVRAGHVDYFPNTTAPPLPPAHQFRWVHVWAPNPVTAAHTDALTADLRPGPDHGRPLARALTGPAGLKPYTVAVAVHPQTQQPVGAAVVTDGHVSPAIPEPQGAQQRITHVWAPDRQTAIGRVIGTSRAHTAREAAHDVAYAAAQQWWYQMTGRPAAERITAVTDAVWQRGYPPVYHAAYVHAANTIAAAAAAAARANPAASAPLQNLIAAAGAASNQIFHNPPLAALRADAAALDAAGHAASLHDDPQPPWRRIVDSTQDAIKRAALRHGGAAAAADTLTGWRARGGHTAADQVSVNGQPVGEWVTNLLTAIGGNAANASRRPREPATGPTARPTATQLAGQDHAPGAPATAAPAPGGRRRPPDQPPGPAAGPRLGR